MGRSGTRETVTHKNGESATGAGTGESNSSSNVASQQRNYNTMGNNNTVDHDPETNSTVSVSNDPELEGLSLYEKKAHLVNRELDSMGMGRYQWSIFFLCGFGYMLDLLWAQAFGLVITPMQQEFGFSDDQLGNLSSSFNAGLTAGAFTWGFLVDIIGRYWAFNFTVLWASVFGLVLGAPNTYGAVVALTAFVGIGVGGNVPIDTTICLECLPQNRRWLLPALSVFQPCGVVLCCGFAYAYIVPYSCAEGLQSCNITAAGEACCSKADNMGWRYLLFTLGGITLFVFLCRFFLFRFQESPKYLLYRGRDEKAVNSLQYIAKYNKTDSTVTTETFHHLSDDSSSVSSNADSNDGRVMLGSGDKQKNASMTDKVKMELGRYKMMFNGAAMARLTILLWLIYALDYWGFSIAGALLPTILRERGSELGLNLEQTYRSYVYIYIFGIPGVLVGASIFGWRQISLIVSSALFGATLFIFTVVNSAASYIGINGLVYFFQSMFNALLYGMTPELFPAPIRGTACGIASFWGRIFSIVAPLAAAQVLAKSLNGVLYMAGSGVLACTVLICFLPRKFLKSQSY